MDVLINQMEEILSQYILCVCAQLCLTLCSPMDSSPPLSSVHGISQAIILEWVAISYSRGSSQPRDQTHVSCFSCIGKQILYHCPNWKALYINIQIYVYIHAHRHMHTQANISLFLKNLFTCHFIYFHLLLCLHP